MGTIIEQPPIETKKIVKFHCSSLSKIMTDPKSKADKEAGNLGETAKTHIKDIWLKNNYGYKEPIVTNEMIKGVCCETESIQLLIENDSEYREKNKERFFNDFIQGEPDVILSDCIEDVKTSWTIKTFFNSDLKDDYWWQGQGYMSLLGIKKYKLTYCLIDTPPELITKEINYQIGKLKTSVTDGYFDADKIAQQIRRNHIVSHLPIEKRIKVFEFDYDINEVKRMESRILKAREFYNTLKL